MKLSFQQVESLFGRAHVEPGDSLVINEKFHTVASVSADGVEFEETDPDDSAEEE